MDTDIDVLGTIVVVGSTGAQSEGPKAAAMTVLAKLHDLTRSIHFVLIVCRHIEILSRQ